MIFQTARFHHDKKSGAVILADGGYFFAGLAADFPDTRAALYSIKR